MSSPGDIGAFFAAQNPTPAQDVGAFFKATRPLGQFIRSSFLAGRIWMTVSQSTNVHSAKYDPDENVLIMGYKGGRGKWQGRLRYYAYSGVDLSEAEECWDSISRGGWVWDELRVRKTLRGTQKPVVFLSSVSEIEPDWLQDYVPGEEGIPVP